MSLSAPTVYVISSASVHQDLHRQNGSQLSLRTYAYQVAAGCPENAEICLIDPVCDLGEFEKTLKDLQVKCIIILLTKDALEDQKVLALARAAIEGTVGRYICHIVHYYWDQPFIYDRLPTSGCTLLPNTDGNSSINLFMRLATYNLSGR